MGYWQAFDRLMEQVDPHDFQGGPAKLLYCLISGF